MKKLKLGLVVNPLAGVGGAVALKGSDGDAIVAEAKRRGAVAQAPARAARALAFLQDESVALLVWAGDMGEVSATLAGLPHETLGQAVAASSPTDTQTAVKTLLKAGVDLLVFAGGDGTARDVLAACDRAVPVLGIPAGCKMHSAVYANNPEDAGRLLQTLVRGGLVALVDADVRDIDEVAFREGVVRARHYGTLQVPRADGLMQQVKSAGHNSEGVDVAEMAAGMAEQIRLNPEADYLMGSGTTVAEVMEVLGLPNTLLGVDLIRGGKVIAADVAAHDILALTGLHPLHAVLTVIGGQGHLFGRGNQQFSPAVIRRIGRENLHVLASRAKLASLGGRPLRLDTGDAALDQELAGWIAVQVGYDERVLYRVGADVAEAEGGS